jgi:RNA polymerase sigma-70 factor (family 1)
MHIDNRYDEKRVLELLSQGSEYAFTQLFDRYRARIYSVSLRYLRSPVLAEEILQEVFLKIWIKRESLPQVLQFEAYLFAMARNLIFDGIKDLAEETTALKEFTRQFSSSHTSDNPLVEKQYEELLQKAVNQLPPQQKQIFRLAKIEGLSHQAIAEKLNISRLTVKRHMATALQSIRLQLQHHITTIASIAAIVRIFE